MSYPLAIVAMDMLVDGESGLDSLDQRIYSGLSLVNQNESKPDQKRQFQGILSELVQSTGENCSDVDLLLLCDAPCDDSDLQAAALAGLSDYRSFSQCVSLAEAITVATEKLASKESDSIIVVGLHEAQNVVSHGLQEGQIANTMAFDSSFSFGEQSYQESSVAAAILLKRAEENSANALAYLLGSGTGTDVGEACQKAFRCAGINSADIEYLEVTSSDEETLNGKELLGLVEEYGRESITLDCAVGSVRSNIGQCGLVTDLAAVIKSALCLHHRYIPMAPGWNAPANPQAWENSPFYVATESTAWFEKKGFEKKEFASKEVGVRKAAVSVVNETEASHFILSDNSADLERPNQYFSRVSWCIFPISGDDLAELTENLTALKRELVKNGDLKLLAKAYFTNYQTTKLNKAYSLVVLGESQDVLVKEVELMLAGLESSFDTLSERKTPKGSFFTPTPVGPEAEVAFVYPGIGAPYVDFGRDLFHLFPGATSLLNEMSRDAGKSVKQDLLYPRSRHRLDAKQKKGVEKELKVNLHKISECGVGMGYLLTKAFREQFKLEPNAGVGYSMGEVSMYVALDAWSDAGSLSEPLADHPTFKRNITGELHALKEYWGINDPSKEGSDKIGTDLWNTYSLRGDPKNVAEVVETEEKVFLTIINTPDNMLIGGDPDGCQRVIKKLGTRAMSLQLASAIHSAPAKLEYDRIVDLYSIDVNERSSVRYYSTSVYKPVPHRTKAIAHSIAKSFTEPVDFPKLIQSMVDSGVRVFVEMGADRSCSTWIDKILKHTDGEDGLSVPHVCVPVNAKGTEDHITIVRALAKLVSHQVDIDISSIYGE